MFQPFTWLKHLGSCIDGEDDDGDLMEVPEEIDEVSFFKSRLGMTGKPSAANLPSTSANLKQNAPVIDYDLDLEYWESPGDLTIPEVLPNDASNWVPLPDTSQTFHSVRNIFRRS